MAALTKMYYLEVLASVRAGGSTEVDGDTTAEVQYGALLEAGAAGAPCQPLGSAGTAFAGISLENTKLVSKQIPILTIFEISGLAVAGAAAVGAAVFCATDNIADLRLTGAGVEVGKITAFNGTTFTVLFTI